jgi:TRAP-type C4-dicarboxylate transport system permease small subunit
MKSAPNIIERVSRIFADIGGVALTFMMCLTVADVVLRTFDYPILGAYEMVGLSLAIVIGFSIPKVSMDRGQVYMEIILERLPSRNRAILNTFTRILCIILFSVIGWNLFLVGNEFLATGEVSPTINIPFFPIAYCVAVCCFLECLVFVFDIVKIWRGQYE